LGLQIVSDFSDIEIIAKGTAIRDLARLSKLYGEGTWRKLKGTAWVRLPDGVVCLAEVHWYEAHGVGKREIKVKRLLESVEERRRLSP